jgi:hypothetical protein
MTMTALTREALNLPLKQRTQLVGQLLESLHTTEDPLTSQEIEKRRKEAVMGKVKLIPAAQVFAEIRKLLKSRKT